MRNGSRIFQRIGKTLKTPTKRRKEQVSQQIKVSKTRESNQVCVDGIITSSHNMQILIIFSIEIDLQKTLQFFHLKI